jgi:hypothetical protein
VLGATLTKSPSSAVAQGLVGMLVQSAESSTCWGALVVPTGTLPKSIAVGLT